MVVWHWQNHQPCRSYWLILIVLQNLPNLFQLRVTGENPSTISSFALLLGLSSRFPTNELRVATYAQKCLRIDYDSVALSKIAIGIWYESRMIFLIGEFVAKVLNSLKVLSRIPDRPTNCKNWPRTVGISSARTEYNSATNPNICQFVGFGACVNRGITWSKHTYSFLWPK